MKYLALVLLLLAACAAPPTQQQVTSRAVIRNCEAQAAVAASEAKQQNVQVAKEGSATNQSDQKDVETLTSEMRKKTFDSCMLKYAL